MFFSQDTKSKLREDLSLQSLEAMLLELEAIIYASTEKVPEVDVEAAVEVEGEFMENSSSDEEIDARELEGFNAKVCLFVCLFVFSFSLTNFFLDEESGSQQTPMVYLSGERGMEGDGQVQQDCLAGRLLCCCIVSKIGYRTAHLPKEEKYEQIISVFYSRK